MHVRRLFQPIVVFVTLVSASWLFMTPSPAAEKIRVRLDWVPWGSHAPIHLAAQKGVFAKHGLEVETDDGNGSVTAVQIVGNGEYDIGFASLAPMAIARSKGLPVVAIAGLVRQNDIGLLVPADGGIKTPADLKGKTIAATASSIEAPFIDTFLAAGKLTRNDVEVLNVDAAAKAGTYIAGRADGAFSSVPFFLPLAKKQRPSISINFQDYGLEFPSFGLLVTEKKLSERRAALAKFASIVSGMWAYTFNGHEDEAVAAMIAARPQAKLDPTAVRGQIDSLKAFAYTAATKNLPFGTMAASDWKRAVEVLGDGSLVNKSLDPNSLYTNDLLDTNLIGELAAGKL